MAANEGDTYAQANLAMYFCHSSDLKLFNRGWTMLMNACDQGDISAKYQMTQILIFGVAHREPDYAAALDLAMDLAELSHPGGYHLIGVMYEHGLGVPVDMARSASWYERAARKGSANGQAALGRLYAIGSGVDQDNIMAYYWLRMSAPSAGSQAYREMEAVRARMNERERQQADRYVADNPAPRRGSFGLKPLERTFSRRVSAQPDAVQVIIKSRLLLQGGFYFGVLVNAGYPPKLSTSDPDIRYHPSTITKNISLKGNEMMTGGSIIIPIDIRILATTMSMIRNGINSRKPISNARRSSLIMKAGIRARSGMVSGPVTSTFARLTNSSRSRSRTCVIMKS